MLKSSYADFIQDWKSLLAATEANAADLPEVESHRLALRQLLEAVEAEKARQTESKADRQVRTQTLNGMMEDAKERAVRLRGLVLASFGSKGSKNERLSQFGMAPQRKRRRRAGKPPEAPPPASSPPTAAPAPAGPPGPKPTSTND